jgi:hypothetical protein
MRLLALGGDAMDIVGGVAGAWYLGAKYQQRVRRQADRQLAQALDTRPAAAAGPGMMLDLLGPDGLADEEGETGTEELLAARLAGLGAPVADLVEHWRERLWHKLARFGRCRLVVGILLGLVLLAPLMALCAVVLPFLIVGFLFDGDKDYRLRIIVLAFALGTCLQVTSALTG